MKNLITGKGSNSIFFFLLLCCCLSAHSYPGPTALNPVQQMITGNVSDATGALAGVSVRIKGNAFSVVTNEAGYFELPAAQGDTLLFEMTGYATREAAVSGTTLNIVMVESATALEEVAINAGYYTTKKKEATGDISRVTAKEIELQPVNNPLLALQGRMPGVAITQATGAPGGQVTLQIRGLNSLRAGGNAPLYVVDGVPYATEGLNDLQNSVGALAGNQSPLNAINPLDISSIEILKDADATAIYGSRGANGVVLITTKKGKAGKTQYSAAAATSFGSLTRRMKMMDTPQYLAMREEAFANDGITQLPFFAYDVNGTWNRGRQTDWVEQLIGGTATVNTLQAGASGGSEHTQFLLSGTYRNEATVFPGDYNYRKGSVHSNLSHHSENGKFDLTLTVNYTADDNKLPATDLTPVAYTLAPNAPALYDAQGNLNWENGTFDNPLAALESNYRVKTKSLISNAVLAYRPTASLELRASFGYTDSRLEETRSMPSTMYNPAYGLNSSSSMLFAANGARSSWIIEPQLQWDRQWGNSAVKVLGGATFQSQDASQLSQYGMGFPSNSLLYNLAAATVVDITANAGTQYRYQAFFGRLNYTYKGRYIVNLTGRRDGSSRFGPGKRYAAFGALGAAWVFSGEELLQGIPWLSFGKLRGSYGTTGSDQIGDYQYLSTYTTSQYLYGGVTGLEPSRLFNPNFGWEVNRKLEVALEAGFLKERLNLTAAWYRNRSSSQLVGIPLPATTGFSTVQANLDATVQNTGLEITLQGKNIATAAFSWDTYANITIPKSKLVAFDGLEGSSYANSFVVGQPITIRKVYEYAGIDPQTGYYSFKDFNNDGVISAPDDTKAVVDTAPKWFGGLGNTLTYKNWELDFLLQFVKQQGNDYRYGLNLAGGMSNLPAQALDRYPAGGTGAEIQQYSTGADGSALAAYFRYRNSDAVVSDASFIRLKNISLSYRLPLPGDRCTAKVYFQGQNLLTFTRYKGADPENQALNRLPPLKMFTLGIQCNF
ncbi:MAG: SusC/RagA family TonB-linked outer membrane protein [Bacteroidia bacterium]